MWNGSPKAVVRDRHGDPTPLEHLSGKPPVLGRGTLRMLSVACLLVIIYGTVGPIGLGGQPWVIRTSDWQWIPAWQHSDFNDVFTNFMVYVPVGLAFRLLLRRRRWAGAPDFLLGLTFSVALSYATELVQQFMPARSANLQDTLVNAIAALVGCLAAPAVQGWLRQVHAQAYQTRQLRSWSTLAWIAAIVTGGLMVVPLRLAAPSVEIDLTRSLDMEDIRRFAMFTVLGFCMGAAALQRHGNRPAAVRAAMAPTMLMALGFELAQIFLASHACGLLDIFVAALGGVTGCAGAAKFTELGIIGDARKTGRAGVKPDHRLLKTTALVGTAIFVIALGLRRLTAPSGAGVGELVVFWIPFQAHFAQPFHRAIVELFETLALYAFLTTLCLLLKRGRGKAVALLLVLGLSILVESLRLLFGHGAADSTPIVLAAVAWLAASRFWNSMTPRKEPSSRVFPDRPQPQPAVQPR